MRASTTAVARDVHGKWAPGASGNPNGRPKAEFDLPAEARKYTPEALLRLVEIMRAPDDERALRAIALLFDRGHGRPVTPVIDQTAPESLSLLHLVAARRVGAMLEAQFAEATAATNGATTLDRPPIDWNTPALE